MQITKQDFLDLGSNKLFIGDPCYVLNHEDYESGVIDTIDTSSQFEGVEGTTSKGTPVTEWCDTKYGDGDYPSSSGKFYGVDAGILGVSVITDIKKYDEKTLNELGQVITVPENVEYVSINVFRDSKEDGDVNIDVSIQEIGGKLNRITEVIYTSKDEEDDYYEDEEDYYEESRKVNRKHLRESEENHTIELLYIPFFKLHCADFPNNDYIESANYDFWGSVDKNCQRLVELNNDLTEFLPEELEGKVTSVKLSIEDSSGLLVVLCDVKGPIDDSVKTKLIEWLNGQMSDGWGENFEQEELGSTEMYACYDENDTSPRPYVEFYDSEREAKEYCQEQNDYEDDEDEEVPYYVYDSVEAYATCSFWKRGLEIPSKVYVDGYDEKGYDVGGYDKEGFNSRGKDKDGFDRNGLNSSGFDREGFDKDGFDKSGRDRDGFDKSGKKASGVKGVNTDRSGKAFIADPYSGLRTQEEAAFRKGYLKGLRNLKEADLFTSNLDASDPNSIYEYIKRNFSGSYDLMNAKSFEDVFKFVCDKLADHYGKDVYYDYETPITDAVNWIWDEKLEEDDD